MLSFLHLPLLLSLYSLSMVNIFDQAYKPILHSRLAKKSSFHEAAIRRKRNNNAWMLSTSLLSVCKLMVIVREWQESGLHL